MLYKGLFNGPVTLYGIICDVEVAKCGSFERVATLIPGIGFLHYAEKHFLTIAKCGVY
jgi:hypothetical protein